MKVNETVCETLKYGYKLLFLCTLSNAEISNNYSAFKNFELADDSIVEMLRTVTIKESLTKSEVINPISVLKKEKRD